MKVNGTSLLTRKVLVTRKFGSEAWHGLFRDVSLQNPAFRQPITASSAVPLPDFLAFHDELVRRFYPAERGAGGERESGGGALFDLGGEAARWALVEGPLKHFVADAEITSLVATFPKVWHRYFTETESRSEAFLNDDGVEFRVRDLPVWHGYLEHFVVGYMKEMLELYCANPISVRRLTAGRGTAYGYLLATAPVLDAPESSPGRRTRSLRRSRPITDRELEVLRLVGVGKTNREIGVLLGISQRTVQHHVAHAYDKLGVYSRAGATLWLVEQGLTR